MRHALLSALLAAALAALPAGAQHEVDPEEMVYAGLLAGGPTLTEDASRNQCVELEAAWVEAERARHPDQVHSACETVESSELERAGDRRWFWTRYGWTTLRPPLDPERSTEPDTVREEEVVLFSAPLEGSRLTAEWHARYPVDFIRGVQVAIGPTQEDGALLGVLSCWNGTGGCQQYFLLRDEDGWRPVRQRWPDQLPDSVGGAFWKGTYVNPLTLQGSAPLYSPDDGNCCPSRMLYVRVRLEGDALVLRDHRVVSAVEN